MLSKSNIYQANTQIDGNGHGIATGSDSLCGTPQVGQLGLRGWNFNKKTFRAIGFKLIQVIYDQGIRSLEQHFHDTVLFGLKNGFNQVQYDIRRHVQPADVFLREVERLLYQ